MTGSASGNKKPRLMPGLFDLSASQKLLQRPEPVIDIPVNLILGKTVALLQLAFELLASAFDHVEIVIGEFAPLLLGLALELFPVAFDPVPIHFPSPFSVDVIQRMGNSNVPKEPNSRPWPLCAAR